MDGMLSPPEYDNASLVGGKDIPVRRLPEMRLEVTARRASGRRISAARKEDSVELRRLSEELRMASAVDLSASDLRASALDLRASSRRESPWIDSGLKASLEEQRKKYD